jgi:hypothetical protein
MAGTVSAEPSAGGFCQSGRLGEATLPPKNFVVRPLGLHKFIMRNTFYLR